MEPQKVTLDQKVCEYHPHVLAFPAGSTVDIQNPDGILHNVHSYSKVNTPFNIAQPKFKKTVSVKIDKPEVISLKCDVHGWMSGWLFVAENPYFSVTDKSGSFKLTDVPPGTYTVEVWHETLADGVKTKVLSQKVTVKPKEEVKVTFEMAKK
jgi:plastocyanin